MNVTITTPAKFPAAFAAARYHAKRGELARIVSPVPVARSRRFGVPDGLNRGIAALGAWNYAGQRLAPRRLQAAHQHLFSAAFDAAASRMIDGSDAVNAWCSTALRTIRAAHRRGIPVVLEVASAHIEAQRDLLRDEYARWGGEFDRAVVSAGVVRRTVREYAEADAIVATSSFVRRTLVERGVDARKIVVVPYGVDMPARADARRGGATPRLLFVGGCSLRKGVPYLLQAFRRLQTRGELRLVGRANDVLFARLGGLPNGAIATGPKSGVGLDEEYARADVFVLPSVEDGWGLVTNEAMAAGLPVIVSDHAGSAEIVRDGENGYVVPARNVDALAERLETLLRDPALRERMGRAARATVEARTWETYGDERRDRVYAPLLRARMEEADALAA
jgi:glycosyltransferase involved in cell wall biosynthesis